ncbi:MAG: hypothetical protein Sapg2KO_24400 [Saprospiraceae bacterium]
MENKIVFSIWIIAAFLIGDYGYGWQKDLGLVPETWPYDLRRWLSQVIWPITPVIISLLFLYGWKKLGTEFGIEYRKSSALIFPLIATLPMLLGYGFSADWQPNITWRGFLHGCLLAAVVEELVYRGFLFGQLFRRGGWGFIPAGLAAALIFGSAHLYQGNDPSSLVGIFMVTAIGSLWFSWLYIEWNYNLWVPIGFHFLMNFYWGVFDMSNNALGGLEANLYRGLTIALSIIGTIYWKKRQNLPKGLTRKKLLVN